MSADGEIGISHVVNLVTAAVLYDYSLNEYKNSQQRLTEAAIKLGDIKTLGLSDDLYFEVMNRLVTEFGELEEELKKQKEALAIMTLEINMMANNIAPFPLPGYQDEPPPFDDDSDSEDDDDDVMDSDI